nr:MAG TPA: hypothetical protein [Caudoviricetes sp.]
MPDHLYCVLVLVTIYILPDSPLLGKLLNAATSTTSST